MEQLLNILHSTQRDAAECNNAERKTDKAERFTIMEVSFFSFVSKLLYWEWECSIPSLVFSLFESSYTKLSNDGVKDLSLSIHWLHLPYM